MVDDTVYKSLNKNKFILQESQFVPIRKIDRYRIMDWRNTQLQHLRQDKKLTIEDQDIYFETVISESLNDDNPKLLLFSYDYLDSFCGYGGLVHIDYENSKAELSFLVDSTMSIEEQSKHWAVFFQFVDQLIEVYPRVRTVYGYCYDIRPWIYPLYEKAGFLLTDVRKDDVEIGGKIFDSLIYTKEYLSKTCK